MGSVLAIASRIVPEGKLKGSLRRIFYRFHNSLYALNKALSRVTLLDGEVLFEFHSGEKIVHAPVAVRPECALSGEIRSLTYGSPARLQKIRALDIEQFAIPLRELTKILIFDIYEKGYKLRQGDNVVDAGAHMGVFTVKAAKEVGDEGRVVAVEPDNDNVRFLRRNIELNELHNVIVVHKGLYSQKKLVKFYSSKDNRAHSLDPDLADSHKATEIEVDTLDNILQDLGIARVDFIKMNIEGAEIEALKGTRKTFENNAVNLAVMADHNVGGEPTYRTVIRQLEETGFKIHGIRGTFAPWRVYAHKL